MASNGADTRILLKLSMGILLVGSAVAGATIVTAELESYDRSPESVTVQPGETVEVTVEMVAGSDAELNLSSESLDGGSEYISLADIRSEAESPITVSGSGEFSLIYDTPVAGDTLTYTVEIADDTPAGTYVIEGTAVTNTEATTGSTTIQVDGSGGGVGLEPAGAFEAGGEEPTEPNRDVSLTSTSIESGPFTVGDELAVTATFENPEFSPKETVAVLRADGTPIVNQTVVVPGDSTQTVTVQLRAVDPGTYDVTVNGRSVETITIAADSTPTPTQAQTTASPTPASEDGSGFGPPVIIVSVLSIVLLSAVIVLLRR